MRQVAPVMFSPTDKGITQPQESCMTFQRKQTHLSYDVWKLELRKDCELQGKLIAFNGIGEYTLKLLWDDGIDPSVEAIVGKARTLKRQAI